MRGFGFFLGFSRGGGGAISAWAGYLLNALGFTTGTSQTLTAPDPVLALDWEGTLTDFGGAVNASGDSVAPPPGSRLVTTVADGAYNIDNGLNSEDSTFETGIGQWAKYLGAGTDPIQSSDQAHSGTYSLKEATSGGGFGGVVFYALNASTPPIIGTTITVGFWVHTDGTEDMIARWDDGTGVNYYFFQDVTLDAGWTYHTQDVPVNGSATLEIYSSLAAQTFYIDDISIGVVYPTVLDTSDGTTQLHPSVTTGGVTDYVFYPTHEVSTAYSSDKFVWAEASDGSTRYYSSSGGTSAGSAPTFPTSGTVVDNDITWTYEGRYGLSGQRVEGSLTNKTTAQQLNPTGTTNITKGGDAASVLSIVDDTSELTSVGLIGVCTNGDVYQLDNSLGVATAVAIVDGATGNTNIHSYSVYARSTVGGTNYLRRSTGSSGQKAFSNTTYERVLNEGLAAIGASDKMQITVAAGDTVFFILPQLEESVFTTSIMADDVAATVTRSAVNLKTVVSDTNLGTDDGAARLIITPLGTGQVGKIWASYTDASNELSVDFTAATITLNKTVAGSTDTATKTYTHADGEQIVIDFAYGSGGMSINSFVVGATAGSAGTNAATSAAVLGTNIQFGASNDAGHINATFDTALKSYATEALASADIDTWSL